MISVKYSCDKFDHAQIGMYVFSDVRESETTHDFLSQPATLTNELTYLLYHLQERRSDISNLFAGEFARENQPHYCGEKPKTVDEYILQFDPPVREQLLIVRKCLREALPDASEKISWSMPTYWNQHNIIHFAAQKKHIGLYPGAEAVLHFAAELERCGLKYSKGAIQIPYSDHLPCDLIRDIAVWCNQTGNHA